VDVFGTKGKEIRCIGLDQSAAYQAALPGRTDVVFLVIYVDGKWRIDKIQEFRDTFAYPNATSAYAGAMELSKQTKIPFFADARAGHYATSEQLKFYEPTDEVKVMGVRARLRESTQPKTVSAVKPVLTLLD
jgi:hypothetical protein